MTLFNIWLHEQDIHLFLADFGYWFWGFDGTFEYFFMTDPRFTCGNL